MPVPTRSYAAASPQSPLAPHSIVRRDVGPRDVAIDIAFCGICHSDIHFVRGEWGPVPYPAVPGHEIAGRVSAVGADVTACKPGDLVGVGCMVDSDRTCPSCRQGLEQFCERGATYTYGSPDTQPVHPGEMTYGGYSQRIVVNQDFVLRISHDPAQLAGVAPLLCAGITTYSPLRHWNVGKGTKIGVVGLGGLGHMAVKLAHALGAEVTLFTRSPGKVADAKRMGATEVALSHDESAMAAHKGRLDFILDTVAAVHDITSLFALLKRDGTLAMVGAPPEPLAVGMFPLVFGRRRLAGSFIGGIRETQEMLDFCARHAIVSDVEIIPVAQVNEAYDRVVRSDVKYRFVIDMATL